MPIVNLLPTTTPALWWLLALLQSCRCPLLLQRGRSRVGRRV